MLNKLDLYFSNGPEVDKTYLPQDDFELREMTRA